MIWDSAAVCDFVLCSPLLRLWPRKALLSFHASWVEGPHRKRSGGPSCQPTFKGDTYSRWPRAGYLAAGKTADDIVAEFPDLTRDQIAVCLDYARELAEFEAVV